MLNTDAESMLYSFKGLNKIILCYIHPIDIDVNLIKIFSVSLSPSAKECFLFFPIKMSLLRHVLLRHELWKFAEKLTHRHGRVQKQKCMSAGYLVQGGECQNLSEHSVDKQ